MSVTRNINFESLTEQEIDSICAKLFNDKKNAFLLLNDAKRRHTLANFEYERSVIVLSNAKNAHSAAVQDYERVMTDLKNYKAKTSKKSTSNPPSSINGGHID